MSSRNLHFPQEIFPEKKLFPPPVLTKTKQYLVNILRLARCGRMKSENSRRLCPTRDVRDGRKSAPRCGESGARAFQRKIFFVDRTIVGRCLRPMCPPDKAAENRNKLRGMSVIVIGPGRWTTRCCHIAGTSLKCPAVLVCNANCDIGLKSGADEESG